MKIELSEQQVNFLKFQIAQTVPHLLKRLEEEQDIRNRLIIKATIEAFDGIRKKLELAENDTKTGDNSGTTGNGEDD